jgi:hypothetical protein
VPRHSRFEYDNQRAGKRQTVANVSLILLALLFIGALVVYFVLVRSGS